MDIDTNKNLNEINFNVKNVGILFVLIIFDVLAVVYFLFEAKLLSEYSNSGYTITTIFVNIVALFEMVRNASKFIGNIKNVHNRR